jgi:uncharacterized protein
MKSFTYFSPMLKNKKPPKKKPEEIGQSPLKELELTLDDWNDLERGVKLFNAGNFQHAHEAWEDVWKRHDEDERLFLQGIIQLAAACHHVAAHSSYRGAVNNLIKSKGKLEVFAPRYLHIEVQPLLDSIEQIKEELENIGQRDFESSDRHALPKIQFHKPRNPDLEIELGVILESEDFFEGVRLFNSGYYWEAHELWEALSREQSGDARELVQAFAQMASAYNFITLSRPSAAKYLFDKILEKLKTYEENIPAVNMSQLIDATNQALQFIGEHDTTHHSPLPAGMKPAIRVTREQ